MGRLKQTSLGDKSGLSQGNTPPPEQPPKKASKRKEAEISVPINIRIPRASKQWLADKAQQVRDNNTEPVPPKERVYPQHLINVAIALLQDTDIDWSTVRNIQDLEQQLNL
ncbi:MULTISPECIES: hypothetical protein [Cyanophyceae]|uniref:hypothetical protein n=1 Tax=Cyanophyceae TaxID=3028117 RepID=UPI00016DCDE0|nr:MULTISPECIES: hypothetical protein [Cyanophyceae]ACB00847.1 hypothetical protein SYNPCC7002_C0002 [Picosynechococcus sp. PCC 7002]SMH59262.1 hypothetical protein SAMN06272755_3336 [Picosynechococcus sp. OG1]SMQ86554.1 hypothetical protein SAMN06272774_3318 [Synechococcus sp. 7002]